MKKLIVAISMVLATSVGFAQEKVKKTVLCYNTKELLKTLMEELGERPVFLGNVDVEEEKRSDISAAVLYNPSTDTFTIIEFNGKVACMISSGIDVELSFPKALIGK